MSGIRYRVSVHLTNDAPIWAEPRWREVFYVVSGNHRHVAKAYSKRMADRICGLLNGDTPLPADAPPASNIQPMADPYRAASIDYRPGAESDPLYCAKHGWANPTGTQRSEKHRD